tara:strand:- start:707 stop:823 length:117 start_codon:yes stop_codon:yes gene_type:complete
MTPEQNAFLKSLKKFSNNAKAPTPGNYLILGLLLKPKF